MILIGVWLVLGGYALLYTGAGKVAGDASCTIGKAIKSGCSFAGSSSGTGGASVYQSWPDPEYQLRAAAWQNQRDLIGGLP